MFKWMPIEELAELRRKEAELPKCPCPLCEAGLPHVLTALDEDGRTVVLSASLSAKVLEIVEKVNTKRA